MADAPDSGNTDNNKPEVSFQSAKDLLGKEPDNPNRKVPLTVKRNILFDELSESAESAERKKLLKEGYCARCLRVKGTLAKCRRVTNTRNLLAHFCNVCSAILSIGTEFLAAMQSLDEIEIASIDNEEMEIIKIRDTKIYNTLLSFKDTLPK